MLEPELKEKKRRILHDFVTDKIAAVDNPCQVHARAVITKRTPDDVDESKRPKSPNGRSYRHRKIMRRAAG